MLLTCWIIGQPRDEPPAPPLVGPDPGHGGAGVGPRRAAPGAAIDADLPCRRCGYSLRGLEPQGVCPECGAAVRLSLMGDFLAASDPSHVDRLLRGALLVEISLYVTVLLSCVGSPIAVALAAPAGAGGWDTALIGFGHAALGLMGLLGWWMVSSPDPGHTLGGPGEGTRRMLRLCLVISGVAAALAATGTASGTLVSDPALHRLLLRAGLLLGAVTWGVQYFSSVAYVRVLAARIPSPDLAATARTNIVMPLWTFGLGIPIVLVTAVIGSQVPPLLLVMILCLAGIGIAVLVWFVWYCSMVSGLRDRLETVRATMPQVLPD